MDYTNLILTKRVLKDMVLPLSSLEISSQKMKWFPKVCNSRLYKLLIISVIIFVSIKAEGQPHSFKSSYVDNNGVKIHYVTKGEGPVMLFLHGFPDFWFTWIYQMEQFAKSGYSVVGMDLRGYNLSDKPHGIDSYKMSALISDVVVVLDEVSPDEKAILVANDWGGAIAWQVATYVPQKVKCLVACNIPHPLSLFKHLEEKPETGSYTKKLTAENALKIYTPEKLLEMAGVENEEMKGWYAKAFNNSSIESMLNYYKVSYPKPSSGSISSISTAVRKIECPILMIHGLKDKAFPPATLNNHWNYTTNSFTLYTIPEAGHFVQRDASRRVFEIMDSWLKLQNAQILNR